MPEPLPVIPDDVRFVKLDILLRFKGDPSVSWKLPRYKTSAFRGGLGNMLLMEHCISDRNCEACSFRNECVVQRIFYHKLRIRPSFVQSGESLGFVIECTDKRMHASGGDTLRVGLILFGDVIVHFSALLQALYRLGLQGLGKDHACFDVMRIRKLTGQHIDHDSGRIRDDWIDIFSEGNVYLANLSPLGLWEYAQLRAAIVAQNISTSIDESGCIPIRFRYPWTQKYQGQFLEHFNKDAFLEAIGRRLYLLRCLEGIDVDAESATTEPAPASAGPHRHTYGMDSSLWDDITMEVIHEEAMEVPRYSGTHKQKITLHGLVGELRLHDMPPELLPWLCAGELTHIGKNTSLGLGKYDIHI